MSSINSVILLENEQDKIEATIDHEGWLSINVFYKLEEKNNIWVSDNDAGVTLEPECATILKEFLLSYVNSDSQVNDEIPTKM
jgi:hypothetical protein